jgi:hypothetical protein
MLPFTEGFSVKVDIVKPRQASIPLLRASAPIHNYLLACIMTKYQTLGFE